MYNVTRGLVVKLLCETMYKIFTYIGILWIIAFLNSCDLFCDDDSKERKGIAQLSENQNQWIDSNITSYVMYFEIGCFCVLNVVKITVENNEIILVQEVDENREIINDLPVEEYDNYFTINQLFQEIISLNDTVDKLEIEYDDTLKYPTIVNVDPINMRCDCSGSCSDVADDEYLYHIEVAINE